MLSLAKGTPIILRLRVADASRWLDLSTKLQRIARHRVDALGGDALTWLPCPILRPSIDSGVLTLSFTAPGPTAPFGAQWAAGSVRPRTGQRIRRWAVPAISSASHSRYARRIRSLGGHRSLQRRAVDIGRFLAERPLALYLASRCCCAGGAVTLDHDERWLRSGTQPRPWCGRLRPAAERREIGRSTKTTTSGTGPRRHDPCPSARKPAAGSALASFGYQPSDRQGRRVCLASEFVSLAGTYGPRLVIRSGCPLDDGYRPPILKSIKLRSNEARLGQRRDDGHTR